MCIRDRPIAAPWAGEEDAVPREEQVQSAVQFLTHPKTQNASLDDRKK